jgi:hypothetical protein
VKGQNNVIGIVVALLVAGLEYEFASALGLSSGVGVVAAIAGAAFALALWLGGVPRSGAAPGARW